MAAITSPTSPRLPVPPFTRASFSSLPHDIVFDICERLSDKDVLKLQLLSTTIRQKLPQSRLNLIHAEKTYYLCSYSIQKLERLVRDPILAGRVTQITFDVGVPNIRLRSKRSCVTEAREYPTDARARLHRWSSTHMRRQNSLVVSPRSCRPSASSSRVDPRAAISYETVLDQTYNLFKTHFLTHVDNSEEDENDFTIFTRITKAFKSLPNLSILTFSHTNPKMVERSEMLSRWKEYNDHLYALLYIDPKIELQSGAWPWCSWLRPKTPTFLLSTACPAILFCATQAERTISEVRVGNTSWGPQNFGLMISKFEPMQVRLRDGSKDGWEKAYYHWVCRYVDDYKATFENLKRFDLCLEPEEHQVVVEPEVEKSEKPKAKTRGKPPPVSLCLLTMLKNVEELKVWRLRGDPEKQVEQQPQLQRNGGFVIPTDTQLPRLEKLDVGEYAGITVDGLLAFLKTNATSARHVACDMFAFREQIVPKQEIMQFLNSLKKNARLESLKIDFLVDQVRENSKRGDGDNLSNVYLRIDIRGSWDNPNCEYKVSLRKVSATGFGDEFKSSSYWAKKRGWEEFFSYMSKLDVTRTLWR
ncbi:hypothetical protein TWF679_005430 [Orbilia oligospora]|uniref:F-box domain-containing protein n=1 Tax=Orbilia oligospora TaxID=2813651 RepID=A0A8H8VC32_ORBOL|nr:hypothetical protein TWF679_005430 [Orbilia oligospora]